MDQVAWDVYFQYPFWGSIIAAYIPIKALAAGLVLLSAYLLWARRLGDREKRFVAAVAFPATIIYFLLAYLDLATAEFGLRHGDTNLLGRAAQVFFTPHFSSFIAVGAWTSSLLALVTLLLFAGYVWPRINVAKTAGDWALRILGPPVALVASIYTALLYMEATARGALIDTALPVLHFLYAMSIGLLALYAAAGEKAYAKAGSYAVGAILGILLLQLLAYSMGFYRADATMAWRIMLTGQNPLIPAGNYGAVSASFWGGAALWALALLTSIYASVKSAKPAAVAAIVLLGLGISLVEFSRLMAVQFVPNS